MYTELLSKICRQLCLGDITHPPLPLKGGYLHKMYSLHTQTGGYAVKLLNPYIMQRPEAQENYRTAEELEAKLEKRGIPILPALTFGGRKMQETDGQYFYLFELYDGRPLADGEIKAVHCESIGRVLADIHNTDRRIDGSCPDEMSIDWDGYIAKLMTQNTGLCRLLRENRTLLYENMKARNEAVKKLPAVKAVCHNDMDSKNVLWKGCECRIIDLECLSFSDPVMEAYELAMCWSGYESCSIDFELFHTFLSSYTGAGGKLAADPVTLYNSCHGRLEWLEYNVRRSLGIECPENELPEAEKQVRETMEHILYYRETENNLLNCLGEHCTARQEKGKYENRRYDKGAACRKKHTEKI